MANSMVGSFETDFPTLPPELHKALRGMLDGLLAQQRQISEAAFADQILQEPRMLLRNIGPMQAGKPSMFKATTESPMGGGTLRTVGQIELVSVEPGKSATVRISSATNADDVARLIESLAMAMIANLPADPAKRQQVLDGLNGLERMSVTDELVETIDLPSGLARHATYRKLMSIPGKPTREEVHDYQRID
jgi:hypothetical protein